MENTAVITRRYRVFRASSAGRTVPNRVRQYRILRDKSVQECATGIGVTRQAIYHAELRNRGLSAENWLKLADFLGCELSVLKSPP